MSSSQNIGELSLEQKRALLAQLLQKKAGASESSYPLSHGQQALWFLYQIAPESAAYNVAFAARIRSDLDVAALRRSFQILVDRHPSLRSTFAMSNGKLVQQVAEKLDVHFEGIAASHLSTDELHRLVTKDYKRPFDLQRGPVFRVSLFTVSANDHVLLLTVPHIAADFWSILVIVDELRVLYPAEKSGAQAALPPLNLQHRDYVRWQTEMLESPEGLRLWEYWQKQLAGELPTLNLLTDKPRPPVQTYQGASHIFKLGEELTTRLKALAKAEGMTLYMLLLAALQVLLYRYSGQEDILVGSPTTGPSRVKYKKVVGYFINAFVLRADLSGNPTLKTFLGQVRQTVLAALRHQDYPFALLVERLQPERSLDRSPVYQVLFNLQSGLVLGEAGFQMSLGELELETFPLRQQEGQTDLHLEMSEVEGALIGKLKYNIDLFEMTTIRRMMSHFETLLESIVANPDERVADLPLLNGEERRRLLVEWNHTRALFPSHLCFHQLFEAQVERTPHAIAVGCQDEQLTYSELNRRANRMARLFVAQGIGAESLVALLARRGINLLTSILAIFKAGAAYLPLDPAHPAQRHVQVLQQSTPALVLAESGLVEALAPALQGIAAGQRPPLLEIEALLERPQGIDADLPSRSEPFNLAYCIYTSGSTGVPKGAMIEHRGMLNHLWVKVTDLGLSRADVVAQTASQCFDISVWQMLSVLLVGGRVEIITDEAAHDPWRLVEEVERRGVTILETVPSLLGMIVEQAAGRRESARGISGLRWLIATGEALSPELCRRWNERYPEIPLLNAYGPTECSDDVTHHAIEKRVGAEVVRMPIGRPVANLRVYVLDSRMKPTPIGVCGEIYVGGVGVGRGYLGDGKRTAEVFLPDPFGEEVGARLYRTGDLGRYLDSGEIEYLGRRDEQVKIRGMRIETGEIEAVLGEHRGVAEAVVMARADGGQEKRLVAYVLTKQGDGPTADELRGYLKERVPEYMVPAAFVMLEKMPLTANGKVDRQALPAPDGARPELKVSYVEPRTAVEKSIAEILRGLLQVEKVGVHDNFFDLGGHSLLLVQAHSKLREMYKADLSLIEMFRYPTINSLAKYLTGEDAEQETPGQKDERVENLKRKKSRQQQQLSQQSRDIAVVGMAGRFPGAVSLDEFWRNLRDGVESVSFFSDEELKHANIDSAMLDDPNYVKAGAALKDIDLFDASFFGLSPREAEIMDPQHRLFLETSWEALENAGYDTEKYAGSIGVFAGHGMNSYLLNLYSNQAVIKSIDPYLIGLANDKDFLPTRVSYKLNLRGPSVAVQTACSTSLVAVSLACQSLLMGQCDMALAGGISARRMTGYLYQEGGILSPDGHCRAFDAGARGTIAGSGAGIVVLKRLEDALADGDSIRGVIKGSAINNDGSFKVGYTAPGIEGQANVIREAQMMAGVEPETIGYIEAHGTGTELGDPIEIEALTQAFRDGTDRKGFCAIGSLKSNVGHLDTAAGVAGLIKTLLALKHNEIPPSINYKEPNPKIDFANSPFYVNDRLAHWHANGTPRRAGVSSFGIGGTNAHVVLEEAPAVEPSQTSKGWHLLLLSARTTTALDTMSANLRAHLEQRPELNLADAAYTLQLGRRSFGYRRAVVCQSVDDAVKALETLDHTRVFAGRQEAKHRDVAFMFSGQGSQYVRMGRELYEVEPTFRAQVDLCSELLKPELGLDLRDVLYPADEEVDKATELLRQTSLAQPALFVIEYALAKLWEQWGVRPAAMIGHSIGEFVAACLAGVFTLEEGLKLVARRGRLMQQMPAGSMLAVDAGKEEAETWLEGKPLSLAAINGPQSCVIAGPTETVEELEQQLRAQGIESRRLHTSHAFHSKMMEPAVESFIKEVEKARLNPPKLPYISNVTGKWITEEEAVDARYWGRHLRETVQLSDGMKELMKAGEPVLLEVGPGQTLSAFAKLQAGKNGEPVILSTLRHPRRAESDEAHLQKALGQLWVAGVAVEWTGMYSGERRQRIELPTYPFERKRFWVEAYEQGPETRHKALGKRADIADWFYVPSWKRVERPGLSKAQGPSREKTHWLLFVDDCGVGPQLAARLAQTGEDVITVRAGDGFTGDADGAYSINPKQRSDYEALLRDLAARGRRPQKIVHLWGVTPSIETALSEELFDSSQASGLYSLIFLTQALAREELGDSLKLFVVTNDLQEVSGEERLRPEKATMLGACKVIPQEYPNITCRSIDVVVPGSGGEQERILIEQLMAEVAAEDSDAAAAVVVAYRGKYRWAQSFEALRLEEGAGTAKRLREGGVYLITGGLGGVGLVLAEFLAKSLKAKLVLVGRAGLPERDEWEALLARDGADNELKGKIRKVLELEEAGAEVLVLSADVSNEEQMLEGLARAEQRFGSLNGVIHGAAIGKEELYRAIQETGSVECRRQFQPKAHGLLVLEKVLRGRELDFCLLLSSLSSVLGGLGFAAYAASNSFMDAFAHEHNRMGPAPWISVNWDGWLLPGDAEHNKGSRAAVTEFAIKPEEGAEVLRRVLSMERATQVIISTGDLQARLDQWVNIGLSGETEALRSAGAHASHPRPNLQTAYVGPRNEIEQKMADIWQELLGIDRVGIHDNFFDLGGDSIIGIQILAMARRAGLHLTPRELFLHQTVAELAAVAVTDSTIEAEAEGAASGPLPPIVKLDDERLQRLTGALGDVEDVYPLSPTQQGMLFHQLFEPNSGTYLLQLSCTLRGELKVAAFERAWQEVVARHPVFRTAFVWEDLDEPLQVVTKSVSGSLEKQDWRALSAHEQRERFDAYSMTERRRGFNLSQAPLIRLSLIDLAEESTRLLLTYHHLLLDGWAFTLFLKEVFTFYEAFSRGENLRLKQSAPFRNYIAWLQQQDLGKAEGFWRAELKGFKSPTPLQLDGSLIAEVEGEESHAKQETKLAKAITQGLQTLAREHQLTLNTLVQGAWALLLSYYSGERDVVFGATVSGRPAELAGVDTMVGLFINTLPVRVQVMPEEMLVPWLRRLQEQQVEAREYDYSPLVKVQEWSEVPRGVPLFKSILVFENYPMASIMERNLSLEIQDVRYTEWNNYPLSVSVEPGAELLLRISYDRRRFNAAAVDRALGHLEMLLGAIMKTPSARLCEMAETLAAADRQQRLAKEKLVEEASLHKLRRIRRQPIGGPRFEESRQ
ncbi:MAG TPA: amino acid adenylation domain-containing protein [Pyrinomonadaceae bacterium]|jgi:amino acid adenylation domain-containing protein